MKQPYNPPGNPQNTVGQITMLSAHNICCGEIRVFDA